MSNQPSESEVNMPKPDSTVRESMRKDAGSGESPMPEVDRSVSQIARFTDKKVLW